MALSQNEKTKSHEAGALASWSLIVGALLGALAGLFFGHPLVGALALGCICGAVGVVVDRMRR